MNFPQNLKYTNEHEWIRVEGDIAYVGITDYALPGSKVYRTMYSSTNKECRNRKAGICK